MSRVEKCRRKNIHIYIFQKDFQKGEKQKPLRLLRETTGVIGGERPSAIAHERCCQKQKPWLGLRWIVVWRCQKSRQPMKCARRSLCMKNLHLAACVRCARRTCDVHDDRATYTPGRDETSVSFSCQQKSSSLCINENRCVSWIKGKRDHRLGYSVCTN